MSGREGINGRWELMEIPPSLCGSRPHTVSLLCYAELVSKEWRKG